MGVIPTLQPPLTYVTKDITGKWFKVMIITSDPPLSILSEGYNPQLYYVCVFWMHISVKSSGAPFPNIFQWLHMRSSSPQLLPKKLLKNSTTTAPRKRSDNGDLFQLMFLTLWYGYQKELRTFPRVRICLYYLALPRSARHWPNKIDDDVTIVATCCRSVSLNPRPYLIVSYYQWTRHIAIVHLQICPPHDTHKIALYRVPHLPLQSRPSVQVFLTPHLHPPAQAGS